MPDFSVINAALSRTGNNFITSLEDGNAESSIAYANYEAMVRGELSMNRWKFATKFEALNLLEDGPPDPWLYCYQIPSDNLSVRNVTQGGQNIDYAVSGDKIYTNVSNDGTDVVLHYVFRPAEADWPPYFTEAMTQRLEALFLRAFEDYEEADARDGMADKTFANARRLDSQSDTPRDPWTYAILAARRA
jgi:hypothetical protein